MCVVWLFVVCCWLVVVVLSISVVYCLVWGLLLLAVLFVWCSLVVACCLLGGCYGVLFIGCWLLLVRVVGVCCLVFVVCCLLCVYCCSCLVIACCFLCVGCCLLVGVCWLLLVVVR